MGSILDADHPRSGVLIASRSTAQLGEVKVKLQTNLDRLTKARTEAAAEGDKAEKARKRAEVYEARAHKAQAELDEITAELIRLRELQDGIRDENLELARAGRELDQANGLKATEGERLDEALAQKKNEYRELEKEENRLGAEIGELERLVDAALRAATAKLHEWRDRAKEAAGAAKAAVSRAFEGLPPLTPAARRRASAEAWYETESADPRRAIEHLRNVLATNTDACRWLSRGHGRTGIPAGCISCAAHG